MGDSSKMGYQTNKITHFQQNRHILGSHHVQDLADMFAWLQAEADGKVPFEDQPLAEMRIEMH